MQEQAEGTFMPSPRRRNRKLAAGQRAEDALAVADRARAWSPRPRPNSPGERPFMTDLSGHQILPARFGGAYRLDRGQAIEILNIAGNQVVDTWAVSAVEPVQIMSMAQTRSVNSSIFARAGMMLMSDRRRPDAGLRVRHLARRARHAAVRLQRRDLPRARLHARSPQLLPRTSPRPWPSRARPCLSRRRRSTSS